MKKVVHAACPHDCPDACGVLVTVEDGRATRIQGDPAHPVTRGFLCAKVTKYLDRVYSPDRVLYPMRRAAVKGTAARSFAPHGRAGAPVPTQPGARLCRNLTRRPSLVRRSHVREFGQQIFVGTYVICRHLSI